MGTRVVVTGLGIVSPLGFTVQENWVNLLNKRSAITKLTSNEYKLMPSRVAGKINMEKFQNFILTNDIIKKSELKSISMANTYALVAAHEAISDCGWLPHDEHESTRAGVSIATGISGITEIADAALSLTSSTKGHKALSPYFVPKILPNLSSGLGPTTSVVTACAAGTHAIHDGFNLIKWGAADVMICGATEASIHPISIGGFSIMRALATKFNDTPELASRPFDRERDGFVMSEGSGILVLENLEHARKRGAESKIYCEIKGAAVNSDASHITNPSNDGDGAYRCMKLTLENAKLSIEDINYVNAHATSTPTGDQVEITALQKLFASLVSQKVYISSIKGNIGHLLGAAGAVETIVSILSCKNKILLPTCNLEHIDLSFQLEKYPQLVLIKDNTLNVNDLVKINIIKNSFGFGGTNASLCLSTYIS